MSAVSLLESEVQKRVERCTKAINHNNNVPNEPMVSVDVKQPFNQPTATTSSRNRKEPYPQQSNHPNRIRKSSKPTKQTSKQDQSSKPTKQTSKQDQNKFKAKKSKNQKEFKAIKANIHTVSKWVQSQQSNHSNRMVRNMKPAIQISKQDQKECKLPAMQASKQDQKDSENSN